MPVFTAHVTVSEADTLRCSRRVRVYAAALYRMLVFPVAFCDPEAQTTQDRPTGMVEQGPSLAICRGRDQVPDKALDVLVPSVVIETIHQDGSADGLYILFSQLTFVASMGQDICPAAPAGKQKGGMWMESLDCTDVASP